MTKEEFYNEIDKLGIKRSTASKYCLDHPELTCEQVLNYYRNRGKSFKAKCKEYNIKYDKASSFRRYHKELTDEQVIGYYLDKEKELNKITFKQKCEDAGVDYKKACAYKMSHKDLTDEQIINIYIKYGDNINRMGSFIEKCEEAGLNYKSVKEFKRVNPEISADCIIEEYIKRRDGRVTFKQKCEDAGVNYETAKHYRQKHRELTDEQVIAKCMVNRKTKFVVFGEEYSNVKEIACKFGTTTAALTSCVNRYKCTYEEAVTRILDEKEKYTAFGIEYKNTQEMLNANGLEIQTSIYCATKRRNNLTNEETINYYKGLLSINKDREKLHPNTTFVIIDGKDYSCAQAMKEFDLQQYAIKKAISNGMTLPEAVMYAYNNNIHTVSEDRNNFIYRGKLFKTRKECLAYLGLSYGAYKHIRKYNKYKDLTNEEIIDKMLIIRGDTVIPFKQDKYTNIFGELVNLGG